MSWDPDPAQFYVTRREAMQMLGEPDRHAFERRVVAGHIQEAGSARGRGSPVLYRLSDVLVLRKNGAREEQPMSKTRPGETNRGSR